MPGFNNEKIFCGTPSPTDTVPQITTEFTKDGTGVANSVRNLSNTASSTAYIQASVAGSSAGDAYTAYQVAGVTNWVTGIDNSISSPLADPWKLSASTVLGTSDVIVAQTGGTVTLPTKLRVGSESPVLDWAVNVEKTTIGSAVELEIRNLDESNTASTAILGIVVGNAAGSTSGDPFVTYNVANTTSWSHGIDNSVASDPFVLSASASLGTTNVLSITTGGAASFILGNLDVTRSAAAATVSATVSNTDNTNAASHALAQLTVGGGSGGDPLTTYTVTGGSSWSTGADNTASDSYKLSQGTALGTNDVIVATTAGEVTLPLTPAFLATHTLAQDNVTGAGATVTVNFTTEIFDQNGDYDGTNTFTAPVTGRYRFSANVGMVQLSVLATGSVWSIVTSNRGYNCLDFAPGPIMDASTGMAFNFSTLADMDAADTCTVAVSVSGLGGNTVDLFADATFTFFSGQLEC